VIRLGQEAAHWWQTKTGCVTQNGSLVVAASRDTSDLKRFARRTDHFREIAGNEITQLEPDLGTRFTRGLFFETEAHLTPRIALKTLRERLAVDGVRFERRQASLEKEPNKGLLIDCRGFSARDRQPDLRGVKGEMLMLSCPEITLRRPIRLLHPRIPLYIVPRGDGIFMLGATMIESSATGHVTARSLLELLSAAYALNPAFGEAEVLEIGVDARPAFPDNLPRIRRDGNVITANGLYRHGFLLAPALGRMVAELIFDKTQPEVMDEAAA